MRILEAWLGNKMEAMAPWEPIIDRINKSLIRFSKLHPTLDGQKLIIQKMIIGRYTQFLTKAQGMPKTIEDALIEIIQNFIWEENTSPRISMDQLYHPIEKGGLNLLDLKTRNEVVEITWLKEYLNLLPKRPVWAVLTDISMEAITPHGLRAQTRVNPFLQNWTVLLRGPQAKKVNKDTKRMLKAGQDHNTNLVAICLACNVKLQLPAWLLTGTEDQLFSNKEAKCLIRKHNMRMIADLMKTLARLRLTQLHPEHCTTNFCSCPKCLADSRKGCLHPEDCAKEVLKRLTAIPPKSNPIGPIPAHDNLSLMKQ